MRNLIILLILLFNVCDVVAQPFTYSGSWAFSDDNEDLILTDPTGTQTFEILKLTNSELKVSNIQNGDEIVTTYTAQ